MYNFIKDNENRIKTLLGDSLTNQYWNKFITAVEQDSGSGRMLIYDDAYTLSASLWLGQCESGSDVSWFTQLTGSLDSY